MLKKSRCWLSLQSFRVGGVPEVGTLAPDAHEVLILQFFEVMRQRTGGYPSFSNLTDDHSFGMGAQEKANVAQTRFRSHRREHVRVAGGQFRVIIPGLCELLWR